MKKRKFYGKENFMEKKILWKRKKKILWKKILKKENEKERKFLGKKYVNYRRWCGYQKFYDNFNVQLLNHKKIKIKKVLI